MGGNPSVRTPPGAHPASLPQVPSLSLLASLLGSTAKPPLASSDEPLGNWSEEPPTVSCAQRSALGTSRGAHPPWPGGGKEGRREEGTEQGTGEVGVGQGGVGWHLFWVPCRAGPSPGSRAARQITTEASGEAGPGSVDRLVHTRQVFAQKNTVKSSCKYNRESALARALPQLADGV